VIHDCRREEARRFASTVEARGFIPAKKDAREAGFQVEGQGFSPANNDGLPALPMRCFTRGK